MKLLLVDDQPENIESLASALRRGGHVITTMFDPAEALRLYQSESFDVVISDVRMPGMSGIDLLKAIHQIDPAARVILITGYGDAATAMAAIHNRAWAMLGKPINIATMMDTLNTIEKEIAGRQENSKK